MASDGITLIVGAVVVVLLVGGVIVWLLSEKK